MPHLRFALPVVLSLAIVGSVQQPKLSARSGAAAPTAWATSPRQSPAPAPATPVVKAVQEETIDGVYVRASTGLDRLLPKSAERTYEALSSRFKPARAMELVTFMDRYWRVAGNTGFNASLDRIKSGLVEAGFTGAKASASGPSLWIEEYANGGNGWEPVRAEMTIVEGAGGGTPERVFDPVVDYIAVCMNSFSTPPGGVVAPLVYVGTGVDAASYASVEVKGAVVLGDGNSRRLWQEAVRNRGAIGIISAAPSAGYTRPQETPEVFQWGGVPYDENLKGFGFNASRRVAERLKARLKAGPVKVKVDIETHFKPNSPGRLLVAEIPGRERPGERVVMVAHIQEPGANDDASGCATLLEMARTLQEAIAAKAIPAPARTITFVWGDEMRASREWLRGEASRPKSTRFMISLDMTGEDTTKTGGTFLIEKEPDPSAVWARPSDPHTEWWSGGAGYKAEAVRGSLLNDLYLAACLRRARDTRWNVQTNPYEGGSDHSIFLNAGVPALLATHFTDRYYHTNLDRADKTSPAEMANVGIATGVTAMLLASAGPQDANAVVDLIARAAATRLDVEARESSALVAKTAGGPSIEAGERVLREAWKTWYTRALESVLTLPVTPADPALKARVEAAIARLK